MASSVSTGTPYSVVIDKSAKEDKVGISFGTDDSGVVVSKIEPNSTISETNLKEGDRVLSIDGKSTENLTAKNSAKVLRDSVGTIEIVAESPLEIKTIAVFGASGQCGREFVKAALDAENIKIRAFVRNSSSYEEYANNPMVEVIQGDASNAEDVENAISGADVVTSFLGNVKNSLIMFQSHNNIMSAAAKMSPPPRCVMISSVGVGGSSFLIGGMLQMIGGKASFEDYEKAEKCVLDTDEKEVPYIVVRPYALNDNEAKGYKVIEGETAHFAWSISRKDVARCFLDYAGEEGDAFVGKAVNIGG